MKNVIYAWNYLEWGGAQVHFLALIKEARKRFNILVVLPAGFDEKFLGYLRELNVDYELFEPAADYSPAKSIFQKLRRHYVKLKSETALFRTLARRDLSNSIVHIDLLPHSSLLILARLVRRTHVFITSHNALPAASAWRERLWKIKAGLISRSRKFHVFCSNQHAKEYFRHHYVGRVASEIEVTYTSMNPEEIDSARAMGFDRNEWLAQADIPDNGFVVLTVGNFIDRKGRWTLLDAAKKIIGSNVGENVYFLWLTPQLPNEEDAKRIRSYELGGYFRLVLSDTIGTDRIDVLRFFLIADAFALPSFVEGLPIALLEALAIGVPSISTNVYGIPEAIKHEETGLLIEAGDAEGLAASILRLNKEPDLREGLAQAGREFAVKVFDEREVAKKVVRAYLRSTEREVSV